MMSALIGGGSALVFLLIVAVLFRFTVAQPDRTRGAPG